MKFNKAIDAMEYIAENDLGNVPVSLEFNLENKPKIEVWYGNFETGLFKMGRDEYCVTIVHDIAEKLMMENDNDEIEDYMTGNAYNSYLIPSEWKHMVVYSDQYVRDNAL
jgi:hypothetical protein